MKFLLAISILFCFVFNNIFAQAGIKPAARYREIAANYNKAADKLLKTNKAQTPVNPTVLTPGDIAVIGFNISNLKFSFVTLVALNPGTVINFTDKGWTGSALNTLTSEGTVTWTTGATTIAAGTVVTVTLTGPSSPDVSGFPNGTQSASGWSASIFAINGDEIIVYQGTEAAPTFIYGLNCSTSAGSPNTTTDWQTSNTTNRDSALPTGLTNSTNSNAATAIAFTGQGTPSTYNDYAYNGKTYGYTGTKAQILTLIGNRANWVKSATALDLTANGTYFPTAFVVSAASPTITPTGTLAAVNTTYGTPTATPTSFTVAGSSLTNDITVTLPTGFETATSAAGTYSSPLTLTQSGGAYSGTVYVRLAANATAGAYSGNITLSSTGATDKTVATVSSTVTAAVLTYVANTASRAVGATDPTFSGTVTGFVNGESQISATTGTLAFTTTATNASTAGTYPINGSGLAATNYTLTQAAGNATALTITLAPPGITSFSPATGPVGTLVTITGTNLLNPTAFTIGGQTAIVVSNTGSSLVAMVMPNATTGGVSLTTAGGTSNAGGNFTVTATPFPGTQQAKLVGTGNIGIAGQGVSVAVSADGNTAIVGGYEDNSNQGAAWVYTRNGGVWTQQGAKLVGTGNTGAALQGYSVSISADGNTAIVGGYADNGGRGAVWVFTRSGGVWAQQGAKLVGTGNSGAAFQGCSVSLSADGNTVIAGGYTDNGSRGAVWVFTRSGGVWTQQGAKLVGTGPIGSASQGWAVAISADGNTFIVGGDEDNSNQGAAWVFTRSGGVWTQQGAKLVGTGGSGTPKQGYAVAINADGNTAIIGGYWDNSLHGAAWIFTRSGGVWTQQGAKLIGTGVQADLRGRAVSLSADGNTAIIGQSGGAMVYTRSGGAWTLQNTTLVGTGAIGQANQGNSVSLSADGYTAFVGGYNDNTAQGAAWAYIPLATPTTQATSLTFTNTTTTGTTAGWTNGNGTSRAVFITAATTGSPAPVDGTAYTANAAFSSGTQIGTTGWYCIYNGTGTSVDVTGLTAGTTYRIMAVEYNGTGSNVAYLTTAGTDNPKNISIINPVTLTATGTLAAVNTTYGTASATPTIFAVTGGNLTTDISVTAPTGFEISTTSGGTYSSTLTLTQSAGTYSGTVYVRLAANATAGAHSGNITLSSTGATDATIATASSDVAKATLTYTATAANRNYGITNPTFTGTVTGFVNSETLITATTGTALFTSTATTLSAVGSYAINGSGLTAANYTFTQAAANATALTIDKAPLTVTATSPAKAYGTTLAAGTSTTNFGITGTLAPGEALTDVTLTPDAAGLSATTAAGAAYSVTPSLATGTGGFLTANYNITYTPFNGTVDKAALTVTASTANKTYGQTLTSGSNPTGFTATGLKNAETIGSATLTYGTGAVATAAVNTYANQVTPSLATGGTFSISNYNVTYNTGSIVVGKAALAIEANGISKVPGTTLTSGSGSTAFVATGLQNGETAGTVTIAYGNGAAAGDASGTYTNQVVASALTGGTITASNYNITYTPGDIVVGTSTITVNVAGGALQPLSTTFGTVSGTTTFTVSGSNLSNDITVTPPSGFQVASSSGGPFGSTVTLTANGGGVGTTNVYVRLAATTPVGNTYNGNVVVTSAGATTQNVATTTSTVNAAPLTITATNVTKTYGTALTGGTGSTAYTLTSGTLKNSNTISSVTITYGAGSDARATASTYVDRVTPSAAVGANGFLAGNYNITYAKGDIIITKKPLTVTAVASSKTYDKTTASSATPTVSGLVAGDNITAGPFQSYDSPDVGTTRVLTPSGIAIDISATFVNYTVNYVAINTGIITPAILTYAATTTSKTYGDTNPAFAGTVTGFATGDTQANATTGTLAFTSAATANSVPGTYDITGSGLTAANYTFTQAAGNTTALTVNKATLTYVATQASKTYGDANPSFTGTVTGFVNSESLVGATTGTLAWASPANVSSIPGTYAINGSGLAAANYTFVQDAANSTKFLVNDFTTPTNPATNIVFSNISTGGFTASWTNGSGTSRAVFIAAVSSGSPSPANNTTYNASTTFGSGGQIGSSGWYCVYNGTGTTVNITGLTPGTDYTVKVVEYNGVAGYEKYSQPAGTNNPKTQATNSLNTTVSSIARNSAALTKNATEQYTVTFGAAISGLSASNFSITTTGTLTGTSVGTITGSGTTYTVTVNTGTGSGDLTLNLANATGLTPGINTSLPFAGGTYTLDRTLPQIDHGTFTSNNTNTAAAKTGDVLTLNFTGTEKIQTPTVSIAGHSVTATNPSTDGINWIATYTMLSGDTEGLVDFSVSASDLVGNAMSAPETAATTHQSLTFDKTVPTISIGSPSVASTNTGPVTYTVTYTDANFNAATLNTSDITLNKTNTANAATVNVSGTGATRTVSLSGITGAGTIGISIAAGTAKDNAGNLAPASSASATFNALIAQTITFASTGTKTYGDANYDPAAISNNNTIGITYASDNTSVATIVSGKVHIVGVGTANITASQAGNSDYTAAIDAVQHLTIGQKALTITANTASKTYGQTLTGGSGSAEFTPSGLVGSESISSVSIAYGTGAAPTAAAGTYTSQVTPSAAIGANGFVGGNYTITYTKGDITVNTAALSIAATGPTKEYGTALTTIANSTTNFSTNGLQNGETITSVTLTPNPAAASATTAAGNPFGVAPSNAVGGNGFVATNYHINYVAVVDFVKTKALTIAAKNANKTYGQELTGAAGSTEFTSTGLANSETIGSVTISYGTGASAASAVGTYTGSVTATAATDGTFTPSNYTISYTASDIVVGAKAITVTAAAKAKTYGDVDPALTYSNTALVGTDAFTGTLTRNPGEDKGVYSIKQGTLGLNSNYTLTYAGADLTIGAKAVTVTAAAKSKTYGDVDPALTYTNTALVGTDAFTGALTRNPGEDKGVYSIKQGTLALSSNYTLTYAGADLTIGAKAVTVTAAAKSKTYGDVDPALTYTNTALVGTDAFTGALTRDAGENTGTYAIKQGTLALSSNYTITYAGAGLTIGTKALTITADNRTKVYGEANPTLNVIYTGFVTGDDESKLTSPAIASTTATAASAVGTYPITANGATSNNYAISYTPGTLTVTPASLTIAADSKTKVYGAANPSLTATYTGFVNGDTNASLTTQPGLATTATVASVVGTYPITASGAASANYSISYTAGTMTVTKANLSIAADNKTKVYGAANPAFTATYTGFVNGDTNTGLTTQPSLVTTATSASAAGTYPITASGAASANYNISYTAGTLIINNSTLTITATNAGKTYGAANPALAFTYSGFVNGDTPASLSTLPSVSTTATAASGAGTYPITVGGAVSSNYTLVYVPATLTVNKAVLNVSADNKSRNYGVANPALTVTYSGFVNGDTQASLTTQATAVTNATIASLPGNYAIIASGAASANYSFSYGSGTFTVVPLTNATLANLTISSGSLSPVFGGGTFNYTASVIFAVNQLTLTPTFDPTATITINGAASGNGTASAPIALASGDNTITIVVTAQDGVTKLTYTLKVHRPLPPADIIPTNVLSPNGDGKNDTWIIKDIQLYPNNTVTIYDRAGREVYSKRGYNNDWDGTLRGAPLAQGTYYYLVDLGPGYETLKGFITILKAQ
ncbi:MAG: MBG domain-containing protein [Bacteroidota bacterium]